MPTFTNVVSLRLFSKDALKFLLGFGCRFGCYHLGRLLLRAWAYLYQDSWWPSLVLTNLSGLWVKLECS